MIKRYLNKTNQTQQIMLYNGECINVFPGNYVDVDEFQIYKEEKERLTVFFSSTNVKNHNSTYKRVIGGKNGLRS